MKWEYPINLFLAMKVECAKPTKQNVKKGRKVANWGSSSDIFGNHFQKKNTIASFFKKKI